jgi:hypothetical protein
MVAVMTSYEHFDEDMFRALLDECLRIIVQDAEAKGPDGNVALLPYESCVRLQSLLTTIGMLTLRFVSLGSWFAFSFALFLLFRILINM